MSSQLNKHDDNTTVTNFTILTNPCHNCGKAIQIFLRAFDLVDDIFHYNGLQKIQQGQW